MTAVLGPLAQKYELLGTIHESGLESIFKVRHRLLEETRAVRVVLPDPGTSLDYLATFQKEVQSTALLRHPHIVKLYDLTITPEGQVFVEMEYVDGVNLRRLRESEGPLSISLVLEVAVQMLRAIEFLHNAGFVHRNLSPEGVLFISDNGDGQPLVKLIDLGLVKSLKDGQQANTLSMFLGKPKYASPEQFSDSEIVAQSDLYSFGVLLYELLTDTLPIEGEDVESLIGGHMFKAPRSFAETDRNMRVPEELRELVLWALAKDPAARPQSSRELLERISSIQEKHGSQAVDQQTRKIPVATQAAVSEQILEPATRPGEKLTMEQAQTVILPRGPSVAGPSATAADFEDRGTSGRPMHQAAQARPRWPWALLAVALIVGLASWIFWVPGRNPSTSEPSVSTVAELSAPTQPNPPDAIQPGLSAVDTAGPDAAPTDTVDAVPGINSAAATPESGSPPAGSEPGLSVTEAGSNPSVPSGQAPGSGSSAVEALPWSPGVGAPIVGNLGIDTSGADTSGAGVSTGGRQTDAPVVRGDAASLPDNSSGVTRRSTVRDPVTGLIWPTSDNQQDVDWAAAKAFCKSYKGGSGSWRLPTLSELESLYDRESQNIMKTRLGIRVSDSGWLVWSSDRRASGQAGCFTFMSGERDWVDPATRSHQRALCVSGG